MDKKGTIKSCKCDDCKNSCSYKPGWLIPNEAEKVAEYLNITIKELFKTKLMVDWWVGNTNNIYLLSLAIKGGTPGKEFPADPKGECVFYKKGLCEIHEVKPFECANSLHDESGGRGNHEKIAVMWKKNQKQIENLLGRKPIAEEY